MTDRWSSDELEGLRVSEAIRQGVLAERDELRAENERLRATLEKIEAGYEQRLSAAELASLARQAL